MTPKTITSAIFFITFLLVSIASGANKYSIEIAFESNSDVKFSQAFDHAPVDNKAAALPSDHENTPHSKATAPHMEELPHIHKFHKGRVKKIKKHHTKWWVLSQIIIVLCHLSILVIAYLHATH